MKNFAAVLFAAALASPAWSRPELQPLTSVIPQRAPEAPLGVPAVIKPIRVHPLLMLLGDEPYEVVLDKSLVKITANWSLGTAEGHFKEYSVKASIDKDDLSKTRIDVVIETKSAMAQNWYLSHAKLREKIQAAKFPRATMKTLDVKATENPNEFEIECDIEVMGQKVKKTVLTRVEVVEGGKIRASGAFEMTIGSDAGKVHFDLTLQPKPKE